MTSFLSIMPQEMMQLKHIFGLSSHMPNTLHMISNDKLIYIAGYYVIVYNTKEKDKSQSYFSGAEGFKSITAVTVSPNKKQMAMAMRGGEGVKPIIYQCDPNVPAKKKKVEYADNMQQREWVSLAFPTGSDSKLLASLSSKANGESLVVFWNAEKNLPLAQTRLATTHATESDLIQILFNPNTSSSENFIVSVLGEKTFKILNIVEQQDKTYQFAAASQLSGIEINSPLKEHLYLVTTPEILILAEGELFVTDDKGGFLYHVALPPDFVGQCLANWSEGFLVGGNGGVALYRHEQKGYQFKGIIELYDKDKERQYKDLGSVVKSMSVFDDKISALLSNGLMQARIRIQNRQITKVGFEQCGLVAHNGAIVSMDVCIRKPLVATAGKDKCIKIWNYEEKTVETTKNQTEAALCLSFHPSGLHLVIAYSDKLRMMNVQKDGELLNGYKDINSFKNCSEIKFSNGGHYFAAVSGTSVHVFKFYTGENPPGMTFTGHTGKIRCIAWSREDNFLVTCGSDGIILAYRVGLEGLGSKLVYIHNSKESRLKGISYSCVTVTNDNRIYAVGAVSNTNERVFKEITLEGIENKRELVQNNAGQIAFPSTGRILVTGVDDKERAGSLKCYKFPLSQHVEEFQAHDQRGVEKLRITSDDKYVISAGRDGCLIVFEIRDKEAKGEKLKDTMNYSNEVLVFKSDLDALKSEIETTKQEKNDLDSAPSILGRSDETPKQLREKYQSDEQQFIQKYNALIQKKNLLKKKFEEEIKTKKEEFENSLQQFDSNQSKNVMQESAQYDQLKRAQEQENSRYDRDNKQFESTRTKELESMRDYYQKLKDSKRKEKLELQEAIKLQVRKHAETMSQIKEEKDQELKKLENQNAKQVDNLTEASLRANSEVSITKKKISDKEQQKERHIEQQRENTDQIARLEQANQILIKDIEAQAQVIQERDKTIGENERKIYELKKKSQQLQKFKYVLDHKIKELKKDIGPREREIADMKTQTNNMDKRLKHYNSLNSGLADFVAELFKNEENLKSEIAKQRSRISYQNVKIKQFKDAVYQAVQFIQDESKLKAEVDALYKKFVTHNIHQVKIDSEIEQEYKNQKKYLEKSVALLKKNLQKDNEIHKQDNIRIMKDNVELIKDINKLRLQTRENAGLKKGADDDKKNKDPREDELREEVKNQKRVNDDYRKEIRDLEQRLQELS